MISLISLLGILGDSLIILSWIPKATRTIRAGKTYDKLAFVLVYVVASFILTVYSFLISNVIFIVLNFSVTLLSGIDLYYKLNPRTKKVLSKSKR